MKTSLKVSAFIVIVVFVIAAFASLIPQLESPAPEALEITGDLSGAELAAVGEQLFESADAGCLACHGLGSEGLRAPDLAGVGAVAAERVSSQSSEEYLYDSIVDPCAFVLEGYDCIMPQTIMQILGPAKVTALIAFLQDQGGEVTVSLAAGEAVAEADSTSGGSVGVAGNTAEDIIAELGCAACHTIESLDAAGLLGPDLSSIGALLSTDQIREAILEPDATISDNCPEGPCTEGVMPKNFGDRLNATQLETLVIYLSELE